MNTFFAITCLFAGLFVADAADIGSLRNLAQGRWATQSSDDLYGVSFQKAGRAVDGNWASYPWEKSCSHTKFRTNPWWQVHLDKVYDIYAVFLKNREDCCAERLAKVGISVDGKVCGYREAPVGNYAFIMCKNPVRGTNVRVRLIQDYQALCLCEVNVLGR